MKEIEQFRSTGPNNVQGPNNYLIGQWNSF